MPLTGNVPHDIKAEIAAGKPQKQAVAIALNEHRKMDAVEAALDEVAGRINEVAKKAKELVGRADAEELYKRHRLMTGKDGTWVVYEAGQLVKKGLASLAEAKKWVDEK